jgi:hypothetical protein
MRPYLYALTTPKIINDNERNVIKIMIELAVLANMWIYQILLKSYLLSRHIDLVHVSLKIRQNEIM